MDVRTLYTQAKQAAPEEVLHQWQDIMEQFLQRRQERFVRMNQKEQAEHLTSEANHRERAGLFSCESFGIDLHVGDICFIDFGADAYQCEIGFQHFGIVMKMYHGKAFVIPMSGNPLAYRQAFDVYANPKGKKHLMRIGKVPGLNKPSTLFLNDCKFINTARIIDVKAHIEKNSDLFQSIYHRMQQVIG